MGDHYTDVWLKICRLWTHRANDTSDSVHLCGGETNRLRNTNVYLYAGEYREWNDRCLPEEWYQNGNVYWYGIHFATKTCTMFYVQTFILLVVVVVGLVWQCIRRALRRSRTPKTTERHRHRNGKVILGSKERKHPDIGWFRSSFFTFGVSIDVTRHLHWTQEKLNVAAAKTLDGARHWKLLEMVEFGN